MESKVINHSPTIAQNFQGPKIAAKAQAEPFIPDGMTLCKDCIFSSTEGELHCRRYPPTVFFNPEPATRQPEVLFPGVLPNWYCGEGKP